MNSRAAGCAANVPAAEIYGFLAPKRAKLLPNAVLRDPRADQKNAALRSSPPDAEILKSDLKYSRQCPGARRPTIKMRCFLALALAAPAVAFAPTLAPTTLVRGGRPLGPNFLKDLGFEKPSWLPDFGGDDTPAEEPKAEEETADEKVPAEAASE